MSTKASYLTAATGICYILSALFVCGEALANDKYEYLKGLYRNDEQLYTYVYPAIKKIDDYRDILMNMDTISGSITLDEIKSNKDGADLTNGTNKIINNVVNRRLDVLREIRFRFVVLYMIKETYRRDFVDIISSMITSQQIIDLKNLSKLTMNYLKNDIEKYGIRNQKLLMLTSEFIKHEDTYWHLLEYLSEQTKKY